MVQQDVYSVLILSMDILEFFLFCTESPSINDEDARQGGGDAGRFEAGKEDHIRSHFRYGTKVQVPPGRLDSQNQHAGDNINRAEGGAGYCYDFLFDFECFTFNTAIPFALTVSYSF